MKQARTRAAQQGEPSVSAECGRVFFSSRSHLPTPLMAPRCFSEQQLSLCCSPAVCPPPTPPLILPLYSHINTAPRPSSFPASPSPRPILITPPQINTRTQTLPRPPSLLLSPLQHTRSSDVFAACNNHHQMPQNAKFMGF